MSAAGLSFSPASPSDHDLSLVDHPLEWSAFSRPLAGVPHAWESCVVFEGMHCAACAIAIEEALRQVPGVQSVEVNAASHRGRIVWTDALVKPSIWMRTAQAAGYRPVPANDSTVMERRRRETRLALWRLGVAGLCMMQVMMYAWPAYVAEPGDISPDMAQLLRWASWVLSMPVMLFSCAPFFRNAWRDWRQGRIGMDFPVAMGMAITFGVSTVGTLEPQGVFGAEVYFDSFTMFVFFLLTGRWLELRLRDRTAGALEALMNRLPESVERRTPGGSFERVAVRRLLVNDVIRVMPGESFPVDGRVLHGHTQVDEALLTGESRPIGRAPGDPVIAGSHNLSAATEVKVERLGPDTRFAQIVTLMEAASLSRPRMAVVADRIARPFLLAVLVAACAAGAYGWQQDPGHALMVAVAVLVVTCPCALSLATPAAMLASAGQLARRGVLVRRLQALESLASVDTVVFDKTGTLTRDRFTVGRVTVRDGVLAEQALNMAAALARHSLHPVSRALVASASSSDGVVQEVQEVAGQGVQGQVACGPDAMLQVLRLGSARFCGVAPVQTDALHACLCDEQGWLATFEFTENIREEAQSVVEALQRMGIHSLLLSGDVPQAVQRVAKAAGISQVRGGCTPQDKLDVMRSLQAQAHVVAMVGDGLNDGPVLAGAHVSFAFGRAVPLTQAQSDFVVMTDHLASIADTIQAARSTMRVVRQNLWWAGAYNVVCIPLAVMGYLPAWLAGLGMALSSLAVVLNALRLSTSPRSSAMT